MYFLLGFLLDMMYLVFNDPGHLNECVLSVFCFEVFSIKTSTMGHVYTLDGMPGYIHMHILS